MKPIALTAGEPSGIGPELCLDILAGDCPRPLVVLGCRKTLEQVAANLGRQLVADEYSPSRAIAAAPPHRAVWDCPTAVTAEAGKPSPRNAAHVLTQLQLSAEGCLRGDFAALVTAPLSKQTILAADAGSATQKFIGQTEFFAEQAGVSRPVMLLAGPRLRVATATTHLPLRAVPDAITVDLLTETLAVLHADLPRRFITRTPPHIRVCGLNPHAGEGGYLGDEERRIIAPALEEARRRGMDAVGPFSADTVFAESLLPAADCVLAMYHDQALPVSKLLDMDETVNVTLGLPFLRVSPAHGTAFDLAGRGLARPQSMRAALALALTA